MENSTKSTRKNFCYRVLFTENEPYTDIELNAFITAKELGIAEDATIEEIQEELLEWMGDNIGFVQGYIWHEITAEGKKRDWLNPKNDYDNV